MANKTFFVALAICIGAGLGAYYEQAQSGLDSSAVKNAAKIENANAEADQIAFDLAKNAYAEQLRCWDGRGQPPCTKFTFEQQLQIARDFVARNHLAKLPATDIQTRNSYLLVAAIAGLIALFNLRNKSI